MKNIILLVCIIHVFACKKNSPAPETSFLMPANKETWWKFSRIDSTINYSNGQTTSSVKLSEELMTVIGASKLADERPAIAYRLYNVTTNTADTILIRVSRDSLNLYRPTSPNYVPTHWYYFFFNLPAQTNRQYPYGVPYIVADTSMIINAVTYNKAIYVWQRRSSWSSSWTETQDKYYSFKDSIGIIQMHDRTIQGHNYGTASTTTVILRSLKEKKIVP